MNQNFSNIFHFPKDLLGLRDEGGGVEGSRIELVENKLILGQLSSTPPPSASIQTDHKSLKIINNLKQTQVTIYLVKTRDGVAREQA